MIPPFLKPQQPASQPVAFPAPVGGWNAVAPLGSMPLTDATSMFNLVPGPRGLRVRDGYAVVASGIGAGEEVRTLIPYHGLAGDGGKDKLFVATVTGIYDITAGGVIGAKTVTFPDGSGYAGYGSCAEMVDANGVSHLAYVDEVNGYYTYDPVGGWAKVALGGGAGQVSNVDPATFCYVIAFKDRLYFVQKGTSDAWYLPTYSYAGAATVFHFGNKFQTGGELVALYHWTVDGGIGVDDHLIAVSRQGDVLIYKGTDPNIVDVAGSPAVTGGGWGLKGQWYIGPVPAGRRIATGWGGDIFFIGSNGVLPLSSVLSSGNQLTNDAYSSKKVTPLINFDMRYSLESMGWSIGLHQDRNLLIVTTPSTAPGPDGTGAPHQYAMYQPTQSWGVYRGLPMLCIGSYRGKCYFGTADGRVCSHQGATDDGIGIPFSLVTAFGSPLDESGSRLKRAHMVRTRFVCDAFAPLYSVEARFNFDGTEVAGSAPGATSSVATWGSAVWGSSRWSGGYVVSQEWRGVTGLGSYVGIALLGTSVADTTLSGFDLLLDMGGIF